MGARIGYGAAWGALPAAGAVAAGADGNVNLAVALSVVVVLAALVAPLAPFLPLLNRLPLVGSPHLAVVLRLNGRKDLTTTVPVGGPQTCLLEVEISNPSRWFAVKGAWMNLLIPCGIKLGRCDQFGKDQQGGSWEDFHRHQLGSHSRADYWYDTDWDFPPRLTKRIRIKLRLGIGEDVDQLEYPILLKLAAPSLYSGIQATGTIRVVKGEPAPEDQMGRLIAHGERLMDALEYPATLQYEIDERQEERDRFLPPASELLGKTIAHDPLPKAAADADNDRSISDRVREHLTALYVVRNELGRRDG